MRFVKSFIEWFTTITTAILMVCALTIGLNGSGIPSTFLRDILIAGVSTSLVTTIIFLHEYKEWKTFLVASLIHFVLLCAIMIFLGGQFGWMNPNVEGVVMMSVDVAVVYGIVLLFTYVLCKKEADELNQALRERNRESSRE